MMHATGNNNVEATSRLGLDNAFTEKTPNTSAVQEPEPTRAASTEAASTSFNRIRTHSLMSFCATCRSLDLVGEKRRQEYHKAGPSAAVAVAILASELNG
jgi:hypothetical protein